MTRFIGRLSLAIAADIAFVSVVEPGPVLALVFGFLMGAWVSFSTEADE